MSNIHNPDPDDEISDADADADPSADAGQDDSGNDASVEAVSVGSPVGRSATDPKIVNH